MVYLIEYNSSDRMQDRETEHRLGRELLQFAMERNYGSVYEVVRKRDAKPFLTGIQGIDFSITHTKGLVACGIGDRKIGVDAEYIRPFDERLMGRICTKEEIIYITGENDIIETREEKFFRLWTLKESFLKATGLGLSFPMREVSFSARTLEKQMAGIRGNIPGWSYKQFWYGDRFIVTICEEQKEEYGGNHVRRIERNHKPVCGC